jgi:uncharacterized membrane-anchored protein
MTDTPIKIEVNCATGIAVEVPLTAEEIAQREVDAAAAEADRAAKEAADAVKATDKAALLAKLGITEEEAQLLLG